MMEIHITLTRIRKKLDTISECENIDENDLFNHLLELKEIKINENYLRDTKIGISVNNLLKSKSTSDLIKKECRSLLKKWKSEIKSESTKNDSSGHEEESSKPNTLNEITESHNSTFDRIERPRKRPEFAPYKNRPSVNYIREGYTKLLYNALKTGDNHMELNLEELAAQIEEGRLPLLDVDCYYFFIYFCLFGFSKLLRNI
uniref:Transcription elongation factor A protein 1 (Trinotate prediction) n=1 Tax=Henneguya salminicola TaxID=69463 RepID=A0A6G3MG65_HENSL